MNTTEKGNKLEDKLYEYLLDQQRHDNLVYDVYPASHCKVHRKQKYYCMSDVSTRGTDLGI